MPEATTGFSEPRTEIESGVRESFEIYQTPEYHVPQALVLDFDRTLGDVEASMARFYAAAERFGVGGEEVRASRAKIENDGGTFSPLETMRDTLSPDVYEEFCEYFVQMDGPSILYDDAVRFLIMLQYSDVPHIILTYGVDPEWQRLKLAAAKYQMGAIVMDHADKGVVMDTLRAPDGSYQFFVEENGDATYVAESLCLIDDKAVAFKNLPPDCTGIIIKRGALLPSQQGETPPGVEAIESLDELIISEDGRLVRRAKQDEIPPYNMERCRNRPGSESRGFTAVYQPLAIAIK